MTRGVDGFGPKLVWRLVLVKHGPSHLNKIPILPLRNTILLGSEWCGILVLYPLFTQEFIHCIVLELSAIVTSNCLDLTIMLTLSFLGKVDEGFLSFIFGLEKEYPSVSCEVINNDKAIPPPPKLSYVGGPKRSKWIRSRGLK